MKVKNRRHPSSLLPCNDSERSVCHEQVRRNPFHESHRCQFCLHQEKKEPEMKNATSVARNCCNLWNILKAKIAVLARSPSVSVEDNPAEGEEEGTNRYGGRLSVQSSRLDRLHCKYGPGENRGRQRVAALRWYFVMPPVTMATAETGGIPRPR